MIRFEFTDICVYSGGIMESFCRICGVIILEAEAGQKYCKDKCCIKEIDNDEVIDTQDINAQPHSQEAILANGKTNLGNLRPWTSGCIDNLFKNVQNGWAPEKTAKETNRDVNDVLRMMKILEEKGFEQVYYSLIEKEKAIRNKRIQENWFVKNGLL